MLVPHNTLVLVADGGRFSLFRNSGRGLAPDLQLIVEKVQHVPDTADLGTDEPGTSFSSSGGRRASYDTTDFHQRAEDEFAVEAAALTDSHTDDLVEGIVVIAAPRTLSALRKSYPPRVRQRIIAEIDKDYAALPAKEIEELLTAVKTPHKAE
jgi:protein required for attachment to host cells